MLYFTRQYKDPLSKEIDDSDVILFQIYWGILRFLPHSVDLIVLH